MYHLKCVGLVENKHWFSIVQMHCKLVACVQYQETCIIMLCLQWTRGGPTLPYHAYQNLHLFESEQDALIKGDELTDALINAAQTLL